jgi:hypothetical protein
MPLPILALGASFLAPFIPDIFNAIAGSDDAASARQKLAPRVNDMVTQMIGRGMSRSEAMAAVEEGIQGAVQEATGKKLLPAWANDAASMAGLVGGGLALGGGKLLASGAKMLSAKASGAAAKAGQMATNMERSAAVQMRKLDKGRTDRLAKGPAKMDVPAAPADTPPAGELKSPFAKAPSEKDILSNMSEGELAKDMTVGEIAGMRGRSGMRQPFPSEKDILGSMSEGELGQGMTRREIAAMRARNSMAL